MAARSATNFVIFIRLIVLPLEVEVKSGQQATRG